MPAAITVAILCRPDVVNSFFLLALCKCVYTEELTCYQVNSDTEIHSLLHVFQTMEIHLMVNLLYLLYFNQMIILYILVNLLTALMARDLPGYGLITMI